ncbi:MAG: hypothetical protein AAFS07_18715 [Pseudomonadota bacterium]
MCTPSRAPDAFLANCTPGPACLADAGECLATPAQPKRTTPGTPRVATPGFATPQRSGTPRSGTPAVVTPGVGCEELVARVTDAAGCAFTFTPRTMSVIHAPEDRLVEKTTNGPSKGKRRYNVAKYRQTLELHRRLRREGKPIPLDGDGGKYYRPRRVNEHGEPVKRKYIPSGRYRHRDPARWRAFRTNVELYNSSVPSALAPPAPPAPPTPPAPSPPSSSTAVVVPPSPPRSPHVVEV